MLYWQHKILDGQDEVCPRQPCEEAVLLRMLNNPATPTKQKTKFDWIHGVALLEVAVGCVHHNNTVHDLYQGLRLFERSVGLWADVPLLQVSAAFMQHSNLGHDVGNPCWGECPRSSASWLHRRWAVFGQLACSGTTTVG